MGDHRASIKIEFEMHGVKDKVDMWINWSPDDEYGCDRRIPEWCADVAARARAKWEADQLTHDSRARDLELERAERLEYERLKQKFA